MLPSQPQVPEIGNKFPTIESFKEAAQQGAKAAGFAFKTRKKITFTKRQNCPVALYAVLDEKAEVWVVQSYKNQYNHELLLPSQSVADVVQWKHSTVYTKDIVNERNRIKNALNESSNNDTTMWLLWMLEECHYVVRHLLSKEGYMKNLFFTHIEAARHAAICPDVLIVAYAEEMSIVEEAFEEVKQVVMRSRDPKYIQNYFEEWKKDSEY
ncbi:hypothetical protein C2G38_2207503 [Gigaspora rosea]|uniref:Uncharacterized protein n=1 Tax=Gigaspora rosea TaxID=44941 RepID=A0A397UMB0_9GLOM|nr:hypothetical protein C2G38_2207503 [Gigaspora rosea]